MDYSIVTARLTSDSRGTELVEIVAERDDMPGLHAHIFPVGIIAEAMASAGPDELDSDDALDLVLLGALDPEVDALAVGTDPTSGPGLAGRRRRLARARERVAVRNSGRLAGVRARLRTETTPAALEQVRKSRERRDVN